MDSLLLPIATNVSFSTMSKISGKKTLEYTNVRKQMTLQVLCSASKRGFGSDSTKKKTSGKVQKKTMYESSEVSKIPSSKPMLRTGEAPRLDTGFEDKSGKIVSDRRFLEKLEEVKMSALAKKKADADKFIQAIDYDKPIETEKNVIGFGTKVGVGVAVVVFGTVFAFGDFLPSPSVNTNDGTEFVNKTLTDEEKSTLQSRLRQFEATLSQSPDDLSAVEASQATSFDALRGFTNALLAAKKPEEAVQELLSYMKDHFDTRQDSTGASMDTTEEKNIDPIQVQLLLGKAYSDWRHVSDAVAVYDQLISEHPTDFRGYLAKGIILKQNGKVGDAERMFIQARFFAPDKAKILVDRYARK